MGQVELLSPWEPRFEPSLPPPFEPSLPESPDKIEMVECSDIWWYYKNTGCKCKKICTGPGRGKGYCRTRGPENCGKEVEEKYREWKKEKKEKERERRKQKLENERKKEKSWLVEI